jgi:hypothetical protein
MRESTGDYWKSFYYLLEDALNVMLVNRATPVTGKAARPCRMRPGWPTLARMNPRAVRST